MSFQYLLCITSTHLKQIEKKVTLVVYGKKNKK